MPEPFKLIFNPGLIRATADQFHRTPGFDRDRFLDHALRGLDDLEMMQRSARIAEALELALPGDFDAALAALYAVLHPQTTAELSEMQLDGGGLRGWALMPVGSFVVARGLNRPEESLAYLREMTKRSSAEFAVRPFFRDHPALTLKHAAEWAADGNLHVRRLASEGSRPRLPWGIRLQAFVADPAPLLPILTALRDDPEEYVRRSVANNLNDIAKDHADLVAEVAADWLRDASAERRKLVRHACRSPVKAGHPAVLAVFGFGAAEDVVAHLQLSSGCVELGQSLTVTATLSQPGPRAQPVLIDIVVRFLRASGGHGAKVFKWTETILPPGKTVTLRKRLPLRDVTTRRHYSGTQFVALQVNGRVLAEQRFELRVPE